MPQNDNHYAEIKNLKNKNNYNIQFSIQGFAYFDDLFIINESAYYNTYDFSINSNWTSANITIPERNYEFIINGSEYSTGAEMQAYVFYHDFQLTKDTVIQIDFENMAPYFMNFNFLDENWNTLGDESEIEKFQLSFEFPNNLSRWGIGVGYNDFMPEGLRFSEINNEYYINTYAILNKNKSIYAFNLSP